MGGDPSGYGEGSIGLGHGVEEDQKPAVRSMVVKMVLLERAISRIHFADILHGAHISVSIGVKSSDVFVGHGKDGAVKLAPGSLDDSKIKPLSYMFFNFLPMRIQKFVQFVIQWLLHFQSNLVQQVVSLA